MRIAELRRALEDDAEQAAFVDTVVGVGYRFLALVEPEGELR
jgi:DNA-binding winged helix-turn-helix (wHTH) protein